MRVEKGILWVEGFKYGSRWEMGKWGIGRWSNKYERYVKKFYRNLIYDLLI